MIKGVNQNVSVSKHARVHNFIDSHLYDVAGFIYVTEVDMTNKRFTYLAPGPGELPSRNLLTGSLKWIET